MNGKIVAGSFVLVALIAGPAMYWLQEYAYYTPVAFVPGAEVLLTPLSGPPEPMQVTGISGIDATSSPLRFRACFQTAMPLDMLTESYKVYDQAVPLNAPGWFKCFDAAAIGQDILSGKAVAFLGQAGVAKDIDAVIAIYPDGRAFAWHQINPHADVTTGAEE